MKSNATYPDSDRYRLEALEPRVMLSGDAVEMLGAGEIAQIIVAHEAEPVTENAPENEDWNEAWNEGLFEPVAQASEPPTTPLSDFEDATETLRTGLEDLSEWAEGVGDQRIPGVEDIAISELSEGNPDALRTLNFSGVSILPGGIYRVSIDGSIYDVEAGGAIDSVQTLVSEFASRINAEQEYLASTYGNSLRILGGDEAQGIPGAGDLDIRVSSMQSWDALSETLPLIDPQGYLDAEGATPDFQTFGHGSVAEMIQLGETIETYIRQPLDTWLAANPDGSIEDFITRLSSLGEGVDGFNVANVLGQHVEDIPQNVNELIFSLPITITREMSYRVDLGQYVNMRGVALPADSPIDLTFTATLNTTLVFGVDLRPEADGDRFFMQLDGAGDDFEVCIEADASNINADIQLGILAAQVNDASVTFDYCMNFGFDPALLGGDGRLSGGELDLSIGDFDGTLTLGSPSMATYDITLPISVDFDGVLGGGQLPEISISNPDFTVNLPEITFSDFDNVEDFLNMDVGGVFSLFQNLGDVFDGLMDLPEFDFNLPFTDDLSLGRLMDLPRLFDEGFLSRLKSPEGELLFPDLQTLIQLGADLVVEAEWVQAFNLGYDAPGQQLLLDLELGESLLFENELVGFDFATGPISLGVSNSTFSLSGDSGLSFKLAIDLSPVSASVEGEVGFVLPANGILASDVTLEILVEGGSLSGGEVVEVLVAALETNTNTSLADLVVDINDAISMSLLSGLIQARLQEGRIAFETTYDGPSPSFLIKAPELLGYANASYALVPPGARVTVQEMSAFANVELHAVGLQASATLGYLDILVGGGQMDFCFGAELDFLPSGPAQLFALFDGVDIDFSAIDPTLTFENDCGVLILRQITVSGGFTGPPAPGHEIIISFKPEFNEIEFNAPDFSFSDTLLNTDFFNVEFVEDFGDLRTFPDLSFELVIDLLLELGTELGSSFGEDIYSFEFPYLNVSLGEIFEFGSFITDLALDLQATGASSIQQFSLLLEDGLNAALALAFPDITNGNFGLNIDLDVDAGVLDLNFSFEALRIVSTHLEADVPGLGTLAELGGAVSLDLEVYAIADIQLGIDLTDPLNPEFLIYQNSALAFEMLLDADPIEFVATVGPLGLFIGPGYIRIHDGSAAPGLQRAYARLTLTPPSGDSVLLSDMPAHLAFTRAGVLESNLPVYFPVRLPANLLFELDLVVDFGVLDVSFDLNGFDFEDYISGADLFNNMGGGLDGFFLAIEALMNTRLFSLELPFIGGSLGDLGEFLLDIRTEFTLVFNALVDPTEEDIQDLIFAAFGPGGLNWLLPFDGIGLAEAGDIGVSFVMNGEVVDGVEIELELGGQTVLVGEDYAFDLGLPFLGFELDAGILITLDWQWELGFGVTRSEGFYMLAEDGVEELVLDLSVGLAPESELGGTMGILFFSAETRDEIGPTALELTLAVDFEPNGSGHLDLVSLLGGNGVAVRLDGIAQAHLLLELGFSSLEGVQIEALPSFLVDFDLVWNFISFQVGGGDGPLGSSPEIAFGNFRLDLGTFFHDFLRPIVEKIEAFLEPLDPVLEFLETEITPLSWGPLTSLFDASGDGKVTVLDLAELYGAIGEGTHDFINSISLISKLVNDFETGSGIPGRDDELYLTLLEGTFNLPGDQDLRTGDVSGLNFDQLIAAVDVGEQFDGEADESSAKWFNDLEAAHFEFMLLQPANVIKLLMGQDIEFFRFTPPSISLEFRFEQSIVVYSPPTVRLELVAGIGFKAQITFGYDSSGIRRYLQTDNPSDIFGGFYVLAGEDKPLITLWGKIGGGASVSAGVGVSATAIIQVTATISLFDPGGGKIYMSQIAGLIETEGLAHTIDCLLTIEMEVTGRLVIKVFVDLPIVGKVTIWKKTIGPVTLLGPVSKVGGACFEPQIADRLEKFEEGPINNDSFDNAAHLGFVPGVHLRGASLSLPFDQDWYSFDLPQTDDLEILLEGHKDMQITLYDENRVILGTVGAGGSATKRIRPGTLAAGRYFLEIRDPNSKVVEPYELDIIPGTFSTTTVYYVASGLANDPKVHSFYSLAAGDDGYVDAGANPERPAATVQQVLDLHTLQAGDVLVMDPGLYETPFTVSSADNGFFVLGASRERFLELAPEQVFGTTLTRPDAGSIITLDGSNGVTLRGFDLVNADTGVALDGASGTEIYDVPFDNFDLAVSGVGSTPSTTIRDLVFNQVISGVDLADADDSRLENLTLTGVDAEYMGIWDTYGGTALRVGGDRIQIDNINLTKFGRGVDIHDANDLVLNNLTTQGVIEGVVLQNSGDVNLTAVTMTLVEANTPITYIFDDFDAVGVRATNVSSLTVNGFDMTGHEELVDLHGNHYSSTAFQLDGVTAFNAALVETIRVENGIQGVNLGTVSLTNSDFSGPVSLAASGDVTLVNTEIGNYWVSGQGLEVVSSASTTIQGGQIWGGDSSLNASVAINLLSTTFSNTDAEKWVYSAGALEWSLETQSLSTTLALSGGAMQISDTTIDGPLTVNATGAVFIMLNSQFEAVTVTASASIDMSDSEATGTVSFTSTGMVSVLNSTFEAVTVTASASIDMSDSVATGTVSFTSTGVVTFDNNQFPRFTVVGSGSGTFTDNTITGLMEVHSTGALDLTGNTVGPASASLYAGTTLTLGIGNEFDTGTLYLESGGDLLLDDIVYSGLGITGQIGGNAIIRDSDLTLTPPAATYPDDGLNLTMTGGTLLLDTNTLTGLRIDVDGAGAITFQDNTFVGGRIWIVNSVSFWMEGNELGAVWTRAILSGAATVRDNTGTGDLVHLYTGGEVLVRNNTYDPAASTLGIDIHTDDGAAVTVELNTLIHSAIRVEAGALVRVQDNDVFDYGIDITNSGATEVLRNVVNGWSGYVVEVDGMETGTLLFRQNTLRDELVRLSDLTQITLGIHEGVRNVFENSGLRIHDSAQVQLIDNLFTDGPYAFYLDSVTEAVIRDNSVTGAEYGLRLGGNSINFSDDVLIETNTFSTGTDIGVDLMDTYMSNVVVQNNLIEGYERFGVHADGDAVFYDNEIRENEVGVRYVPQTGQLFENDIHDNVIGLKGPGFLGNDDRAADRHNLIYNNQIGVVAESNATVAFNRVYDNVDGIHTASDNEIRHNLVFRNTGVSILVSGGQDNLIRNNTVYSPTGSHSVHVTGGAVNVTLRNNILWSVTGHTLMVDYLSDVGFDSDYNNLFSSGSATLTRWWVQDYDDLLDWQIDVQQDLNSIGYTRIDPTLDQPAFVNLGADDFRIVDLTSTTINSGDPGYTFGNEPGPAAGPNGLRINQGAFGDTLEAALSPASYVRLLTPRFYLDWAESDVRRLVWESFNLTGNVTLEVHEDGGAFADDFATVDLFNQPAEVDSQPATWGSYFWSPSASGISGNNAKSYFFRIVHASAQTESRESFVVPTETTDTIDINDFYLSPTGDNRATGQTAGTAKASIYSYLQNYTLGANMTLHVAAGTYFQPRDVIISSNPDLGGDTAFKIAGPAVGTAVFDRYDQRSGTTGLILDNADFMTLSGLTLSGGYVGLDIRNGSTFAILEDLILEDHQGIQIHIHDGSDRASLSRVTLEDGGSHGLVVEQRLDLLEDSVILNHAGTGVRLTDSGDAVLTGNQIEGNAAGGLWVDNGLADTTTVIGNEDLGLELGNVFLNNNGNQLEVEGGALIAGNTILRTPDHADYHTGRGILTKGQSVRFNVVQGHSTGIEMTASGLIEGNRISDNTAYGIRMLNGGTRTVLGNVIYSGDYGVYTTGYNGTPNDVYRNNLLYDLDQGGIYLSVGNGATFENNTFMIDGGFALSLASATGATLRNNIFSQSNGVAIYLSQTAQTGFVSDYNLFDLGAGGKVGRWAGVDRVSFVEWRGSSFHDANSLATDPLFVDLDGADDTLGFVDLVQDGRDDEFHLQSLSGSAHGASNAPVRDVTTSLPVWGTAVWTSDAGQSPGIDRGFDGSAFADEPGPNGGFVNLGAFGNTGNASLSPLEYVLVLGPQGGETWPMGQTFNISWRSHDFNGTVDIVLRRDSDANPVMTLADDLANSGSFAWTLPVLTAADDYRVEILRNEVGATSGISLSPFSITETISVYYVNDADVVVDGYTTASGDNANDGLSAATPKASIRAILEAYTLSPGDMILVDSGEYAVTTNIVLDVAATGILIRGFDDPARPDLISVLNRESTSAGNYIFELQGAEDVVLEDLVLREAYQGIYAAPGEGNGLTVLDSSFLLHDNAGIKVESGNSGLRVEDSHFEGNGAYYSDNSMTYGIHFQGLSAEILNNVFTWPENREPTAIYLQSGGGDLGTIRVEGNQISGSRNGIYAGGFNSGTVEIVDNTIDLHFTQSYGIQASGTEVLLSGNTVSDAQYGLYISGGVVAEENEVFGSLNGIYMSADATARNNLVYDNTTGILASGGSNGSMLILDNEIRDNSGAGILVTPNGLIAGNYIHGNGIGIHQNGGSAGRTLFIRNNRIVNNVTQGLSLSGGSSDVYVYNNTILQESGQTILVNSAGTIDLRNNIVISDGGTALQVENAAQGAVSEDYNLYQLRTAATAFQWGGSTYTTTTDWYYGTGHGAHSFFADPLFVDEAGSDFHLLVASPGVNAGDPLSAWILEPGNHGSRVNLGAYGNSTEATEGDAQSVTVLDPFALTKGTQGQPYPISFLASGFSPSQVAARYNIGSGSVGHWLSLSSITDGYGYSVSSNYSLDLSGVSDDLPEEMFRQYNRSTNRLDFELLLQEGNYDFRLHFMAPSTSATQVFDVEVDNVVLLSNYNIFTSAGGAYQGITETVEVSVGAGGLPTTLSLVALNGTAYISGLEILRRDDSIETGTFKVEVSYNDGVDYELLAQGVTIDSSGLGQVEWTPANATAGQSARVRVTSEDPGAISGVSDAFLIANNGNAYYVNDGSLIHDVYTSAVGDNLNSGKDPSAPMASLDALLAAYSLQAGDVVYVDSGVYAMPRNILLDARHAGITIRGALDESDPDAVTILNRDNRTDGAYLFEFSGADGVTLENLEIQNAYIGVYAAADTADDLTISNVDFTLNGQGGIYVYEGNTGLVVEEGIFIGAGSSSSIDGATLYGIYHRGGSAQILNNTMTWPSNGWAKGIDIYNVDAAAVFLIEGNQIDGPRNGISATGFTTGQVILDDNHITIFHFQGTGISTQGVGVTVSNNIVVNLGTGINMAGGLAVGNQITGGVTGINLSSGATGRDNQVDGAQDGIYAYGYVDQILLLNNIVWNNSSYGIEAHGDVRVEGNIIHSNNSGIYYGSVRDNSGLILNNRIYNNTLHALYANSSVNNVKVLNNTFVQIEPGTALIRVASGRADFRNNIFSSDAGTIFEVDAAAVPLFYENYNLLHLTGNAVPYRWEGRNLDTQVDIYFATGQSEFSLYTDPLFVDPSIDDYDVLPASPTRDAGDPYSTWVWETEPSGWRANIGDLGNTAAALTSPGQALDILGVSFLTKLVEGREHTIEFLATGYAPGRSTAFYNTGNTFSGSWEILPSDIAYTYTMNDTEQVDLSGTLNPAPEDVYRSIAHRTNQQLDFDLALPDGNYRFRLHLITVTNTAGQTFHVDVDGVREIENLNVYNEAGDTYRAITRDIDVTVSGGTSRVSLIPLVGHLAGMAGIEIIKLDAVAPASTFTVKVSYDDGGSYETVATGVTIDERGVGSVNWTPDTATAGRTVRVRVLSEGPDATVAVSDAFLVANSANLYYVNDNATDSDVYTSAVGDNLNTGKDASSPMASLEALFTAYNLGDGDIIYVDTGSYVLSRNLILGAAHSGLTIVGATDPNDVAAVTVLDRGNRDSGGYVFELDEVTDLTLRHIQITGAYTGIMVTTADNYATGTDNLVFEDLRVFHNTKYGLYVGNYNGTVTITGGSFEGLGEAYNIDTRQEYGIYSRAVSLQVSDTLFTKNYLYGIYLTVPTQATTGHLFTNITVERSNYGFFAATGGLLITDSLFQDNRTVGVNLQSASQGESELRDSVVQRNGFGNNTGSGIYLYNTGWVENTLIQENRRGVYLHTSGTVIGNVIFNNTIGVYHSTGVLTQGGLIEANRIFGNTEYGIQILFGSAVVRGNQIYSNPVGIAKTGTYAFSGLIENNILYHHGVAAISIDASGGSYQIVNNTIYEEAGIGLQLEGAGSARVLNNIFKVDAGFAITVEAESAAALTEINYNLFHHTGAGFVGEWESVSQATLGAWQTASGQDENSLFANPNFFDPNGADDVLGYREVDGFLRDGGIDDNFHLRRLSPAIDSGSTVWSSRSDFDGDERLNDSGTADTGGSRYVVTTGASLFDPLRGVAQGWNNSSTLRTIALPFTFSYFGEEYNELELSVYGLLGFPDVVNSSSNTEATLLQNSWIAPLWDRIDLYSDVARDIYIDSSVEGEMYIRWQARNTGYGSDVQFSVLLREDGLIRFDYGSDNSPLSPTVGLSFGNERDAHIVETHNDAASLDQADSITFTPVAGITDIGAFEFKSDSTDVVPPVVQTTLPAEIASEGVLVALTDRIQLTFSEEMDSIDAISAATFELLRDTDGNGLFTSADTVLLLTPSYDPLTRTITLVSESGELPEGYFRLRVRATNLRDLAGNELDGDNNGSVGGDHIRTFTVVHPPAVIENVEINQGETQRSRVTSISVTFDRDLGAEVTSATLRVYDRTTGELMNSTVTWQAETMTALLTFASYDDGSLPEGQYSFVIDGADFSGRGLDGDDDGLKGGVYSLDFHRLYGDTTANGIIDNLDLVRLRHAYNQNQGQSGYDSAFDNDASNHIGQVERDAVLSNINVTLDGSTLAPLLVRSSDPVVTSSLDADVTLEFVVLAPVPVTYVWYFEGVEIARAEDLRALFLEDLIAADFGTYQVAALSDNGDLPLWDIQLVEAID